MTPERVLNTVLGRVPYRWQLALLERVLQGEFPTSIQFPTGSGKSCVPHVFLAALAWFRISGVQPPTRMPRRLVFFVDRRNVVGQLAREMECAQARVAADPAIRDALCTYSSTAQPVQIAEIRGGRRIDNSWTLDPGCPTVLLATQLAVSRVLFSGYGSGRASRHQYAGLMGCDAWWVVDECHLSRRALRTLDAVASARAGSRYPIRVTRLGVFAGAGGLVPDGLVSGCLVEARVTAPKTVTVHHVPKPKRGKDDGVHAAMCDAVLRKVESGARRVMVFRTSPAQARDLASQISETVPGVQVLCVTGLTRGHERVALYARPEFQALVTGVSASDPVVVVSTSVLEDGADLYADAMVVDAVPGQSLVNRLGRLNRAAEPVEYGCTVVVGPVDADGTWGAATAATVAVLDERCATGAWVTSPLELMSFPAEYPETVPTQESDPAVPTVAEFQILAQTTVKNHPLLAMVPHWVSEPDDGQYVSVVWRDVLDHIDPEHWVEYLGLCPVQPQELARVRRQAVFDALVPGTRYIAVGPGGVTVAESGDGTDGPRGTVVVVLPSSTGYLSADGEFSARSPFSEFVTYDVAAWEDRECIQVDSDNVPEIPGRYVVADWPDVQSSDEQMSWIVARERPSSRVGAGMLLDAHHSMTRDHAEALVRALELDPVDSAAICAAAPVHDDGKRGVWQVAAGNVTGGPAVAKSLHVLHVARLDGARHELESVWRNPGLEPVSRAIVLRHHGYGCPSFSRRAGGPSVPGPDAAAIAEEHLLAAGAAADPWIEAYLDAVFHAADVRGSIPHNNSTTIPTQELEDDENNV